ncbi:MAG TPA: hypothetical protein DF613_05680 [Lachnospiraceae bacterium]|nr:hypothetical protein [Lachnospiraceae bacterium]
MGGYRRRRRGGGCLSSLLAVFVLVTIVICIASIRYNNTTEHHRESAAQIRVTPLPASAVHETAYYTDELGWIRHASALENALEDFYTSTGVQPHIYLSETYRDQSEADSLYSSLFTDEGHFLLVIADDWNTAYILGDDAARVLTDDVMVLFWENFDDCADSSRADEDVLTDAFTYTTDALSPDTSPEPAAVTESERRTAGLFMILAIMVFLVVVIVIVTVIVRARKNARYDEASRSSFTRNTDDDTTWHTAPSGGNPSDSESGGPQPRGYNLNGEFHSYDED